MAATDIRKRVILRSAIADARRHEFVVQQGATATLPDDPGLGSHRNDYVSKSARRRIGTAFAMAASRAVCFAWISPVCVQGGAVGKESAASLLRRSKAPAETLKLLNSSELRRMGGIGKTRAGRGTVGLGLRAFGSMPSRASESPRDGLSSPQRPGRRRATRARMGPACDPNWNALLPVGWARRRR